MINQRCLYCYQPLANNDFHPSCSKKFFGKTEPPELPYALNEMRELANEAIRSSVSVTGVQAKLSLDIEQHRDTTRPKRRLTIVGMWGQYVLKPPPEEYDSLPEIEDITMHLAEAFKIRTVPHTLVRLKSGELAYLTRRVDRADGKKHAMEDMCQLTERLTEDKYKGSMEQIGKTIKQFSENRGFDLVEFFRITIFSFLTGNADMHLKNFSLLRSSDDGVALSPAYDLVATTLIIPEDKEETALTINGKKGNLRKSDFQVLANSLGVSETVYKNTMIEFSELLPDAIEFIGSSFLKDALRDDYRKLLAERSVRLGLGGKTN
jgi:serine/threonine-protein kinase HipA